MGASGEVKGVTLAREILNYYFSFSSEEKLSFFNYLFVELDIIPDDIRKKLDIYEANKTKINYLDTLIFAGLQELNIENTSILLGKKIKCLGSCRKVMLMLLADIASLPFISISRFVLLNSSQLTS